MADFEKQLRWFSVLFITGFSGFLPSLGWAAQDASNIQTMLKNFTSLFGPLMLLIMIISFVAGIYFIFRGITALKKLGMMQTQMMQPGEIGGPLVHITVGAVLIYLPTSTNVIQYTFFGDMTLGSGTSIFGNQSIDFYALGQASEALLTYDPDSSLEQIWASFVDTLFLYIQFIGFIAFVRGWFLIAESGHPGVQQKAVAKGIIHVVGGIIAINAVVFVDLLRTTLYGEI